MVYKERQGNGVTTVATITAVLLPIFLLLPLALLLTQLLVLNLLPPPNGAEECTAKETVSRLPFFHVCVWCECVPKGTHVSVCVEARS